jgi:hypothetical protein
MKQQGAFVGTLYADFYPRTWQKARGMDDQLPRSRTLPRQGRASGGCHCLQLYQAYQGQAVFAHA